MLNLMPDSMYLSACFQPGMFKNLSVNKPCKLASRLHAVFNRGLNREIFDVALLRLKIPLNRSGQIRHKSERDPLQRYLRISSKWGISRSVVSRGSHAVTLRETPGGEVDPEGYGSYLQ